MMRSLLAASAVAGLVALAGCETTSSTEPTTRAAAAMGMLNDTCPMSGEPVDPNAATVQYGGYTVGFCCNACSKPWAAKPDAEKAAYVKQFTK